MPARSGLEVSGDHCRWQYRQLELALIGQNLAEKNHGESGTQTIPRSLYGKATARW